MIPFLKKKQEASISEGPDEVKIRKPDEEAEFGLLDAVVEDILEAIQSKDKGLLKSALAALIDHIKEEDEIQDESLEY